MAPILQRMDDVTECAVIEAAGARVIKVGWMRAASLTSGVAAGQPAPGPKRFAAPVTPRLTDRANCAPARLAHGPMPVRTERAFTGRAGRRETGIQRPADPPGDRGSRHVGHTSQVSKNPAIADRSSMRGVFGPGTAAAQIPQPSNECQVEETSIGSAPPQRRSSA